ncbi:MAG: hypothetical protein Q8P93_03245 [bacterium]|nr:hypothetical protein [bacterium]
MTGNPVAGKPGTYLLVLDLPEMMEAYERVGLQIPDVVFFKKRQERLATKIQEAIPDCSVETIEANKLMNKIASLLHNLLLVTPEAAVISTVSAIASKTSGRCLQINRLVDPNSKMLGLGARPGNGSLHNQFAEIRGCLEKRPVILVEDGCFTGETMKSMIEICSEMHIEIKHLVIGLLFPSAKENILKAFPKVKDVHCWRDEGFLDWMPDHDFYPFVPNAGKVVGFSYNGHHVPVYLHNGLSLCMPYVLPYGKPVEWASIPKESACGLSLFCVREAISIFEEMEGLNKERITLERLIGTYPHVGLPVCDDEKQFPHIETRILDILHDDVQVLA